jgi:lipoprotein-releasing system permease protein
MLSSFTLISLIGVMLGVLVLVVVMAVYAGLERNVKERLLGFTPHVLLEPSSIFGDPKTADWKQAAEKVKNIPHVETATAFVTDNVIVDYESWQRPVFFRGVDTSDPAQISGIVKMLDLKNYPESTADLGIDDRVVISSILAEQLHVGIGEKLRLYSTRNFREVMQAYKVTEKPPMREAFAAPWKQATESLKTLWQPSGEDFTVKIAPFSEIYNTFDVLRAEDIRQPEVDLLSNLLLTMEAGGKNELAEIYRFTSAQKADVENAVSALNSTEAEKMDGEILKGLKSIVLPKEAEIVGVYKASQMTVTPDLFIPLPLAQDLSGLGDAVQGISLRLDDAYQANSVAADARNILGEDWTALAWADQPQVKGFSQLINQQRVMMYFSLSFIVLVAAFSMMANIYTVTIQKRREIGVMKALGAAPDQIVRVFLYQGMILGFTGAILGVGFGRLVIHFRREIQDVFRMLGFDPFTSGFVGFDTLPAFNDPWEQTKIALMAFILCSLAALVPAFFAARSDAAKSLRNL